MKRFMDVTLSLVALLLLAPLLLLVCVSVVVDGGFPVFFRQARVGKNARTFSMYKFRSMVKNAAAVGPYYTLANDARITPLGRFLRRSSIDELPQLINVFFGDMSLVGPRPHVPAERSLYTGAEWTARCSVQPGITGLAQTSGRSSLTFEQQRAFDLAYVQQHSIWRDIRILWQTGCQLRGRHTN